VQGADQALLNTKFQSRGEPGTHRNYAALLASLAAAVPDGMIAFFPSYGFLESCVAAWHAAGSLQALLRHKLVFLETRDARETALALAAFKRACDAGRGALLLCVARGKVTFYYYFALFLCPTLLRCRRESTLRTTTDAAWW
jgi:DNA excision repair protein ERCC-2